MATSSLPMLRVANMFRCPIASPQRLQRRQFQSIHRLMRPSPPRSQFKPSPPTSPLPSLAPPTPIYGARPLTRLLPATLIALCTTIYASTLYAADQLTAHANPHPSTLLSTHFVLSLPNLRAGNYHTLLTHTLTHFTPLHLALNMYALYSFAPPLIARFGPAAFLALFFSAGIIGGAVPLAWQAYRERHPPAPAPARGYIWDARRAPEQGPEVRYEGAVGASAAVLGLVGAEACVAPRSRVYVFPLPVAVPAYVAVGGFMVFSAAAMEFGWLPGWGHLAHLTGTTVGGLAYALVLRGRFRR